MSDFWMLPVATRMITGRAVEETGIKKVIALETEADLGAITIKEARTIVVASNPLVAVVISVAMESRAVVAEAAERQVVEVQADEEQATNVAETDSKYHCH
jgi:hypothetical protein